MRTFIFLTACLLALGLGIAKAADDPRYRETAKLTTLTQNASNCMRKRVQYLLNRGETDNETLFEILARSCGSALYSYMTRDLQESDEGAWNYIKSLASSEVSRVRGLVQSVPHPTAPAKP